jgi:hypothetical protein
MVVERLEQKGTVMQNKTIKRTIVIVAGFAVLFFGLDVFAGEGRGCSRHSQGKCSKEGYGKGYGPGGYCGRYASKLSTEEMEAAKAEREAFLESTRELRQQAYQKDLVLQAELAKQKPDPQIAAGIQKEISGIWAAIDLKHLEHRLRMQAINPELGRGHGYRRGKGSGGPAKGACWQ